MFGSIKNCHNVKDFRKLAKKKLPSPIFHYIDGGSDDEVTYRRNTESYEQCDLIPDVLSGVNKETLDWINFMQIGKMVGQSRRTKQNLITKRTKFPILRGTAKDHKVVVNSDKGRVALGDFLTIFGLLF